MAEREDIPLLSRFVRQRMMTQASANEFVRLALLNIPIDGTNPAWDAFQNERYSQPLNIHPDQLQLFFDRYMVLFSNGGDLDKAGAYSCVEFLPAQRIKITYFATDNGPSARVDLTVRWEQFYDKIHVENFSVNGVGRMLLLQKTDASHGQLQLHSNDRTDPWRLIGSVLINSLYKSLLFMLFNDELDRHLFKVKVKGKNKLSATADRKEQLVYHSGSRIIYLDNIPSGATDSHGYEIERKPHERRGHRKTLRHERYRYHPLYMVYNAIKVKSAWVGPETFNYQGATYTLMRKRKER